MNKQDNRLALSVLAALTAAIALIYTLIMYHRIVFAVAGMSVLFLITAYILTQNIIAFLNMKSKSSNVQLKDCLDDISAQLEAMNGAQSQIGKATYLYTKQAAQAVTTLEQHYTESQEALYKNLSSLSNVQNKSVKLMIKYDQNNTTKLIATIKDLRNHLSETMIHGFDQLQPNNTELVALLEQITVYLKTQPNNTDHTLGLQLGNVAHELQNISNSIQNVQLPVQNIVQTDAADNETSAVNNEAARQLPPAMVSEPNNNASPIEEPSGSADFMEEDTLTDNIGHPSEPEKETLTEELLPIIESEAFSDTPDADESTALFTKEEAFTPTFTVIGKSEASEAETPASDSAIKKVPEVDSDSNKQLSPDEIAALFAAAEPAPPKSSAIVDNPSNPPAATGLEQTDRNSVSEDSNKQLSADEIAALFAAAEPSPQKEETAESTPVSEDPNKQLTPDEIAALFSSLG